MTNLSFVDTLLVTVVGIAVVFAGLTILIGLIKIMQVATSGMGKKKEAPKAAPAPAPAPVAVPAPVAAPAAPAQDDAALIAVISAAVAAMMADSNTGFVVRRVRRVSNTPAWSKSGREEQVYSRF